MLESFKSLFTQMRVNVRLFIFIIASMAIINISNDMYKDKTEEFQHQVYTKLNTDILKTTNLLIKQKENASLMLAISLSTSSTLIDIVFGKPYIDMKLKELSSQLNTNTSFKNIWFSIFNEDGDTIKRSWTKNNSNKDFNTIHIENLLKSKRPSSISQFTINKFGLVMNNITPINYEGEMIGAFNVITHFNSITDDLLKFNFKSVVILDESSSKEINVKTSLSKKFIGNAYVVNNNADKVSMKIIENRGLNYYIDLESEYFVDENTNSFETVYKLKDIDNNILGYIILMHYLDEIDMGELEINQEAHIYFTAFILFSLALITYFSNSSSYISQMKEENKKLTLVNSTLNDKNDELDFNEKKIANMFHIQPNFMILSDGQSIENVNERMLWLLNATKENGVKDIQSRYRCISEAFEPCDDTDIDLSEYFHEGTIKGSPWKDYILNNFKRSYKVCMRDPFGKQHHFTIKISEMKYATLAKRYIIISFIDITSDVFAHRKAREELEIAIERTKTEQIHEVANKIQEPLSVISLTATDIKFKNDMKILKESDIDSLSTIIVDNAKIVTNDIDKLIKKEDKVV